jgi:CRISPR-associated protein Cmr6
MVEKLLDLVHPQQDYQVKQGTAHHAAFMMISLYQPELNFGISSTEDISDQEWAEIWQIWEKAMAKGLGSRVCAGYGHPSNISGDELYPPHRIHGRGMASKTLSGAEFRPNMFRAAIRGHALRIFGGLVPANIAEREVDKLFGGLGHREPIVGLIGMKFVADPDIKNWQTRSWSF